ncbi:uncharacterized protein LOC111072351 isoform X2 [Drosophila obscura]|uniref:uncharacterized protein LOC111072351 isoform X2 n=1 Tax=Drosophila obscura TaxID=7282 RepID=UPI001BB15257|nr:uncharacterized protein LOC111072351 isoform X2 [Drosophila obscura]
MIQNLPTEITDKVFGYLKETDQLQLAQITNENFNAFKPVLNMTCIETLSLYNYDYRGIDLLQYVNPYCKNLHLDGISTAQGLHIRKLTHLEKLEVNEIRNIFEICSHLKKLRELTVGNGLGNVSDLKLDYLYPELEHLMLSFFEIALDLPVCSKLKRLTLLSIAYYIKKFGEIIGKYANTLKYLHLLPYYSKDEFYANNLIIVIRKCKRLEFLITRKGIIRVLFFSFLESLITALKENGFNTDRRLKMEVHCGKTDELKQELMNLFPNSEVWNLITLIQFDQMYI